MKAILQTVYYRKWAHKAILLANASNAQNYLSPFVPNSYNQLIIQCRKYFIPFKSNGITPLTVFVSYPYTHYLLCCNRNPLSVIPRGAHGPGWPNPDPTPAHFGLALGLRF